MVFVDRRGSLRSAAPQDNAPWHDAPWPSPEWLRTLKCRLRKRIARKSLPLAQKSPQPPEAPSPAQSENPLGPKGIPAARMDGLGEKRFTAGPNRRSDRGDAGLAKAQKKASDAPNHLARRMARGKATIPPTNTRGLRASQLKSPMLPYRADPVPVARHIRHQGIPHAANLQSGQAFRTKKISKFFCGLDLAAQNEPRQFASLGQIRCISIAQFPVWQIARCPCSPIVSIWYTHRRELPKTMFSPLA